MKKRRYRKELGPLSADNLQFYLEKWGKEHQIFYKQGKAFKKKRSAVIQKLKRPSKKKPATQQSRKDEDKPKLLKLLLYSFRVASSAKKKGLDCWKTMIIQCQSLVENSKKLFEEIPQIRKDILILKKEIQTLKQDIQEVQRKTKEILIKSGKFDGLPTLTGASKTATVEHPVILKKEEKFDSGKLTEILSRQLSLVEKIQKRNTEIGNEVSEKRGKQGPQEFTELLNLIEEEDDAIDLALKEWGLLLNTAFEFRGTVSSLYSVVREDADLQNERLMLIRGLRVLNTQLEENPTLVGVKPHPTSDTETKSSELGGWSKGSSNGVPSLLAELTPQINSSDEGDEGEEEGEVGEEIGEYYDAEAEEEK